MFVVMDIHEMDARWIVFVLRSENEGLSSTVSIVLFIYHIYLGLHRFLCKMPMQ